MRGIMRSTLLASGVALVVAVAFGASLLPRVSAAPGAGRTIYMAAVEPKGGTAVAQEPFPSAALPTGGGYILRAPDSTGRWEVSTYQWQPSFIVVNQGENVTLEIVGINGARHEAVLVSPSGAETPLVVTRGRMTRVRFQATEAGVWRLVCNTHPPGMTADILVIR